MFKYKKYAIYSITILYILLTIIEFVKYMLCDSNLFGLVYLLISMFIIFLLIPICYNYKKYYSMARISKLIIIIVIGFMNSFILKFIIINNLFYIDSSNEYIRSIFVIKSILKPIIYSVLIIFTLLEFRMDRLLFKNKN